MILIFSGIVIRNGSDIKKDRTRGGTVKINTDNTQNVVPDVCSKGTSSNNYEQRVALLTECINSDDFINNSENSYYFFKRGFGYENIARDDLALKDYLKAIELKPAYEGAYFNAGNIYYRDKKYGLALQNYNKVVELNPNNSDSYYNRGQIYRESGECKKAIEEYTKTISLNNNYAKAFLNRAYCLKKQNKFK